MTTVTVPGKALHISIASDLVSGAPRVVICSSPSVSYNWLEKAEVSRAWRPVDQGYGRGGTPVFTGVFKPVARVTLYLTDENGLGTCCGAA